MLEKILPNYYFEIIKNKINIDRLNEIRIRINKPILVFIGGQAYFICEEGVTDDYKKALVATKTLIQDIIFRASECSIYSVNEQIKNGFLTGARGVRLGLCGTLVVEKDEIKTIKDFSSINIRIPHEIKNASLTAFDEIVTSTSVRNTLIVSPPGAGKTTFLRDFVSQLSNRNICLNVLIVDERGEIVGDAFNNTEFSLGKFYDVISFSKKAFGIRQGIRVMTPNIIITDELGTIEDIEAIKYASNCGVKVMASIHASDIDDVIKKSDFKDLVKSKLFERYVILSCRNGPGTYEGIYNENLERLHHFNY